MVMYFTAQNLLKHIWLTIKQLELTFKTNKQNTVRMILTCVKHEMNVIREHCVCLCILIC